MITKSFFVLLTVVLLSGCSSLEFKSKTIVIPETEAVPELAHSNGEFEVNKIYRMFEDEERSMQIFGWTDDEHLIGKIMSIDMGQTMRKIDYRKQTSETVTSLNINAEPSQLSPDRRYISLYAWDEHEGKTTKLYDLKNDDTTTIVDNNFPSSGMIMWSNNSRYVAFFLWDDQWREEKLHIYDVTTKKLKQVEMPLSEEKSWVRYAKMSDDGQTVLIVYNQSVLFGKLDGNQLVKIYEHKLSNDGAVDYLNNDQIMFVSENNLLFVFDRRNKATSILSEQIGAFRLTADRKYIAYSKDAQNTYVAKLQGNNLLNEQEVFKGMNPAQLEWNPSGKKLYVNGWKSFDAQRKSKTSVLNAMQYIIEFK
ncbi:hypothetical protein [Bacillus sp. FJAT-26390]|uniref:hypothetical protein n=1 Tax=Bacillus sp. FJAT-26390 TaxID=1743142 RepID=UPI000807FFBD|nr:hypothetical protein [Bacillus sp. FJAT-26390]OBZ12737.1 hypothetical protein A7975_17260 [Bacillus sp. FJAT-26390]